MKRRELIHQSAAGAALALAGTVPALAGAVGHQPTESPPTGLSGPPPAFPPLLARDRNWLITDGQALADWWAEFHDAGRFEQRVARKLAEYQAQNWSNNIHDRITLEGMVYGLLCGFRNDGTVRIHPDVEFMTAGGDRAHQDVRLGTYQVCVGGAGVWLSFGHYRWYGQRQDWVWEDQRHVIPIQGSWRARTEAKWRREAGGVG